MTTSAILVEAIDLVVTGRLDAAHAIVQQHEADRTACWIHAVIHKLEQDEANSRYWYRRAGQFFESYADTGQELAAIRAALTY